MFENGWHCLRGARVIAHKTFEPADGNSLVLLMLDDDALRLALALLRADAAADRGEDARLVDRLQRCVDIVQQKLPDEGGNIDADRAARDAGGLLALDAALGFAEGVGQGVAEVDFLEIGHALLGVALGHRHLMRLDSRELLVGAFAFDDEYFLKIADVIEALVCLTLFGLEPLLAGIQLFEIHEMAVEIRPVDAGEFHLAANGDAARAAHAGAVDHDGV